MNIDTIPDKNGRLLSPGVKVNTIPLNARMEGKIQSKFLNILVLGEVLAFRKYPCDLNVDRTPTTDGNRYVASVRIEGNFVDRQSFEMEYTNESC